MSQQKRDRAVDLFQQGYRIATVANYLKVLEYCVRDFRNRWVLRGKVVMMDKPTKTFYSFETKKEIITRHLGGETQRALAREYGLSSEKLIKAWMRRYRAEGESGLRPKPRGRPPGARARVEPVSEEQRLRRQVQKLQAENAYLKAVRDLSG